MPTGGLGANIAPRVAGRSCAAMDALEDNTVGLPHGSNLMNRLEMLGTGPPQFYGCYKNNSYWRNTNKRQAQKTQEISTLR